MHDLLFPLLTRTGPSVGHLIALQQIGKGPVQVAAIKAEG